MHRIISLFVWSSLMASSGSLCADTVKGESSPRLAEITKFDSQRFLSGSLFNLSSEEYMRNMNIYDYSVDYVELRARAETGDGVAAFTLFIRMGDCHNVPKSRELMESEIAHILNAKELRPGFSKSKVTDEEIAKYSEKIRAKFDFCQSVPSESGIKNEQVDWLLVAAKKGILEAQFALANLPPLTNVIDGQDFERSKQLALKAIDGIALGGDLRALELLWEFYWHGQNGLPKDNARAYAYLMASVDIKLESDPNFAAGFTKEMITDPRLYYAILKGELNSEQLEHAELLRSQIVGNWISLPR